MRTVYLETTIVSYYVARPSRDVATLARQEMTRDWWDKKRGAYRSLISPAVLEEAKAGDPDAARRRLNALEGIELLEYDTAIDPLAVRLRRALGIPRRKAADALHLAYAVRYEIEILLTWNCEHLAAAETQRRLADFAWQEQLWLPVICTPEQMGA
jgi:predicted nucleic acid-binding protein